jgi:serine/threonine protein kinase
MELFKGCHLKELLRDRLQKGDENCPFTDEEAATITKYILKGLEYIHSLNYMHRDIKPENILIDWDNFSNVKLIDFGFAVSHKANCKS